MTEPRRAVDLSAVARDDAAIEALRAGATDPSEGWDDPGLSLLASLLVDVSLPCLEQEAVPATPAVVSLPGRGAARRAAAIAAAAVVGAAAFTGVAAASPGSPFGAVGHAFAAAVGHVVDAVVPGRPEPRSHRRVARTAPGSVVSDHARSRSAAGQVAHLLDQAETDVAAGRVTAATELLDTASRLLPQVLGADGATGLATRVADLRSELSGSEEAAAAGPAAKPSAAAAAPRRQAAARARDDNAPRDRAGDGARRAGAARAPEAEQGSPEPSDSPSATSSDSPDGSPSSAGGGPSGSPSPTASPTATPRPAPEPDGQEQP